MDGNQPLGFIPSDFQPFPTWLVPTLITLGTVVGGSIVAGAWYCWHGAWCPRRPARPPEVALTDMAGGRSAAANQPFLGRGRQGSEASDDATDRRAPSV